RTISFGADAPEDIQYGLRTEDGITYLARGKQLLLASHEVALRGRHNYLNALAALAIGDLMELPMAAMLQVLHEFPGLPHRMRHVATRRGVEFINDSKATNTGAAVASIESVDNTIVLIAGGDGKGGDFSALARALQGKLRGAVLMGKDAQRIGSALADMAPTVFVDDMQQAVAEAANMAAEGDTVLLAPACASIDQYKNYAQRGDMFAAAVEALGR
ncbi:MAG TPA: cyanophycin synthetase, partial [Woeseiaceae bacterium]